MTVRAVQTEQPVPNAPMSVKRDFVKHIEARETVNSTKIRDRST